jgi:Amt family ammonium transporter
VGITAGCSNVDALGALIIGAVAGILVVVAVEFIVFTLPVDDPVGAVAVHGFNGVWGTLAVGLFAAPIVAGDNVVSEATGLFYGGGLNLLGVQALGIVTIAVWTTVTITITFFLIKAIHGLRVSPEDEIVGLDSTEHGLTSSYADFLPVANPDLEVFTGGAKPAPSSPIPVAPAAAIPVTDVSTGKKLTKVTIITKQNRFEALKVAMDQIGITGITVTNVLGYGIQRGSQMYRGVKVESQLLPKIQIDIVISKVPVEVLVETVKKVLYTGNIGYGKIFVYDVENVIKVRTGETGYAALQDIVPGDE